MMSAIITDLYAWKNPPDLFFFKFYNSSDCCFLKGLLNAAIAFLVTQDINFLQIIGLVGTHVNGILCL